MTDDYANFAAAILSFKRNEQLPESGFQHQCLLCGGIIPKLSLEEY